MNDCECGARAGRRSHRACRAGRSGGTAWTIHVSLLVVALGGCSRMGQSGPGGGQATGWSQIRLPETNRETAFEAGTYAMRQWFRLSEVSEGAGTIRSAPEEYEQKGGTGRIRDEAIGFRNRMRRTATLMVREQEPGCLVKCQVRVERLDTSDHRVFHMNEQFQDTPHETPIDRDAGVSPGQDQVWTDMPRDRELEQQILALIRSKATGSSTQ